MGSRNRFAGVAVEPVVRTLLVGLLVFGLGLGAAVLVASPRAGARTTVDGTITGGVADGAPDPSLLSLSVASVAPGTYEFDVSDNSTIHNFDICPGKNRCTNATSLHKTVISGTGDFAWDITLTPGTYTYQCDMHASMTKHFTVTGTGTTTTGTTETTSTTQTTTQAPLSVRIVSTKAGRSGVTTVAAASQLSRVTAVLLRKGKKIASTAKDGKRVTLKLKKSLAPGRYVVKVTVKCCGGSATAKKTIRVR
jgi:plastocyanin